jgi:hypothetical protein
MSVLVEDAAEAVASLYAEASVDVRQWDGWGQCAQWPGVRDALVRPVQVVELLKLAQSLDQVLLIPDQGPVEQLAAAVGFQNSAIDPELGFYAARSYSLMRPPRTGWRWIRFRERSAAG